MKLIASIGALCAAIAIFAATAAYAVGLTAAAVIGINALFGTGFNPWSGVVLYASFVVITVAANVLLGGERG